MQGQNQHMKPLIWLNIGLAIGLSAVIAWILVERYKARNRNIAHAFEALEAEYISGLPKAWTEGYIAAYEQRNMLTRQFQGKGRMDPVWLQGEVSKRFWSGTNANPYWKLNPR
jgi:hypothetical protein